MQEALNCCLCCIFGYRCMMHHRITRVVPSSWRRERALCDRSRTTSVGLFILGHTRITLYTRTGPAGANGERLATPLWFL